MILRFQSIKMYLFSILYRYQIVTLIYQMRSDIQINYLKPSVSESHKYTHVNNDRSQNVEIEQHKYSHLVVLTRSNAGIIKPSKLTNPNLKIPNNEHDLLNPNLLGLQNQIKKEGKKKTVSFNNYTPPDNNVSFELPSTVKKINKSQYGQDHTKKTVEETIVPADLQRYSSNHLPNSNHKQKEDGLNRYLSARDKLYNQDQNTLKVSNFSSRQKTVELTVDALNIPHRKQLCKSMSKKDFNSRSSSKIFKVPSFLKGKHSSRRGSICLEKINQLKQPISQSIEAPLYHQIYQKPFQSAPSILNQLQSSIHQKNSQFQIHIKPAIKKCTRNDFKIIQKIGKGGFANAFIAVQKNLGFVCVLKILQKSKIKEMQTQQVLLRQIKIQSYLQHKHLTNLYGFFDDQSSFYLILELLPEGNLKQRVKDDTVSERIAANIIYQLCSAVNHMHCHNIIHRDIKPENMFIFNDYIKLGDFGCAVNGQSGRTTFVGSPIYLSPEQLRKDEYDAKVDVWQIGTILYELLFGICPFISDIAQIVRGNQDPRQLSELQFPPQIPISKSAKDFIMRSLNKQPYRRMTIKSALQHIFLKDSKSQFESNKGLQ